MKQDYSFSEDKLIAAIRIIFYICAGYFFLIGSSLIFLPRFLLRGLTDNGINPAIIGMLRGAGGSIIPYSMLYILIALNPVKREWALGFIFLANILAISLDLASLLLEEFRFSYAMIDLPVEITSVACIIIVWIRIKIQNTKWFGRGKDPGS